MENQTVTIPMETLMELLETKAKVSALQSYINADNYPDKRIMCNIVGVKQKEED